MSFRSTLFALLAAGLMIGAPMSAQADKEVSVKIYKQGKKKYNLGDFAGAIELFKQAYDEFEAPAYLYNIAQAYRQLDNCEKSLFFYERFLAEKPGSTQEATIQGYVKELQQECPNQGSDSAEVLDEIDDPIKKSEPHKSSDVATELAAINASNQNTRPVGVGSDSQTSSGPLLVATAELGPAFFNIGEVIVPVSGTLRLGAAYSMEFGEITVEPGLSILLSNMAYEEASGDSSLLFSSIFANAAASYPMTPEIRVGGELGLGLFRYGSIAQGNPFTVSGMELDSASSSFGIRVGGSVEYAFSEALGLSASPGFTYASSGDDLASDIKSITNLQLLGGVRYRL